MSEWNLRARFPALCNLQAPLLRLKTFARFPKLSPLIIHNNHEYLNQTSSILQWDFFIIRTWYLFIFRWTISRIRSVVFRWFTITENSALDLQTAPVLSDLAWYFFDSAVKIYLRQNEKWVESTRNTYNTASTEPLIIRCKSSPYME